MEKYFEKKIICNEILFRYAKGKSLVSGYEIHPYNEVLFYIDGGGKLLTENFEENLKGGTLIIIPKNTYHSISFSDEENYTRLVLNFPDMDLPMMPFSDIRLLYPMTHNMNFLLERMCRALKESEHENNLPTLLYGAFLMLLSEISGEDSKKLTPKLRKNDELISKCIQYIDENFGKDLTIETIANEMNVSASTLFQCFNHRLGIPVYRYITEKRLIHAHNLIGEGHSPTKIYLECGYRDYATFWRAYVKMFGVPPSKSKF
jgi:AraC-like DNA-binding protein